MLFWGSSDLDSKLSKKIESDVEELKKQLSERQPVNGKSNIRVPEGRLGLDESPETPTRV